jgi:ligand-binding sensor domain-containing protein
VGTTRGTYCYDPIKENFKPFKLIPIGEVNAIHEYAGFIWLLSNGKLYRYNSYTGEIFPFDHNKNTLVAITSSKKGGLWITDNNSAILRYQVNTGKFIPVDLKKIDRRALANTKTVYAINDSLLMVGTINSAYLFDFKNGTLKNLFASHYLNKVIQANCIIQQTESIYWIGTETGIYT